MEGKDCTAFQRGVFPVSEARQVLGQRGAAVGSVHPDDDVCAGLAARAGGSFVCAGGRCSGRCGWRAAVVKDLGGTAYSIRKQDKSRSITRRAIGLHRRC